jgi:hypothetical protein
VSILSLTVKTRPQTRRSGHHPEGGRRTALTLKRKQDLFDRRFALYKKAVLYYEEIWSEMAGTSPDYDFKTLYVEASFLFGPDVVEHLKTMTRKTKFDIDWFAEPFRRYMQLK